MLLGAPVMVALMRNGRDDRRLAIAPAHRRHSRERAQRRARAVGGDQQTRSDRRRAVDRRVDGVGAQRKSGDRSLPAFDAEALTPVQQPGDDVVVHRHVRERYAVDLIELHLNWANRVADPSVDYRHLSNWLGERRDRLPSADPFEHAARSRRDRACAIAALAHAEHGIDDQDRGVSAHRLFQRGGERKPCRAGPGDHEIE